MIIYINGIKATAEDLNRLENDLKTGRATATARANKYGIFYTVQGAIYEKSYNWTFSERLHHKQKTA